MDSVIYFPYASPPVSWLKAASLMWDQVWRITSYKTPLDDEDVRHFSEALGGFLKSIYPTETPHYSDTYNRFIEWIDKNSEFLQRSHSHAPHFEVALYADKLSAEHIRELVDRGIAITKSRPKKVNLPKWEASHYYERYMETTQPYYENQWESGSDADEYFSLQQQIKKLRSCKEMYTERIAQNLEQLEKKASEIYDRNIVTIIDDVPQVVLMNEAAAYHFLSLVASAQSRQSLFDSRRNERTDLTASNRSYADTISFHERLLSGHSAISIAKFCIPEDLDKLQVEQIVSIRNELLLSRTKFQVEVNRLVKELADISSEDDFERTKTKIIGLAREKIDQVKKIYNEERLSTAIKAIEMSLTPPAVVGCVASMLGVGLAEPMSISAAISVFSVKTILEWRQARSKREDNAWSYILDVRKALG